MKFFGFKRSPAAEQLNEGQLRVAGRLAASILSAQRRLADYLNQLTRGISPRSWLVLLSGFCLFSGAYLIYLLWQAFY